MKPPRNTTLSPGIGGCQEAEPSIPAHLAFSIVRVSWGCLLLVGPSGLMRALGLPFDRRVMETMRVLGFRHLVQGAVVGGRGRRLRVGVLVDLIHGASMLLLACVNTKRRRAALLDACVAFGFAAGGLTAARKDVGHLQIVNRNPRDAFGQTVPPEALQNRHGT